MTTVWQDGSAPAYPPLAGDCRTDCCVVGLGASGLTAAIELAHRGARVVAIDANVVGGGAAGRNGGFLLAGVADFHHDAVNAHGRAHMTALYRRTMTEIDRLAHQYPGIVRRTGSLRIAADAAELDDCQEQHKAMQDDGLPVEHYHGPEGDGLLFPDDAAFNPFARCHALAAEAKRLGVTLCEQTTARAVAKGEVTTPRGTIHCDKVIVAVDGRLEQLLPELAGRVRTARLQMLSTVPIEPGTYPRPVYLRWGYEYWQQLPDGRIAIGGFRDIGGEPEWTDHPDVSDTIQDRLETLLSTRLHLDVVIERRWAGLVGYTPGGLPIVEEARTGVWAVGGYNGTGNLVGTIAARGIAEVVMTGASAELAELAPGLAPHARTGDVTGAPQGGLS